MANIKVSEKDFIALASAAKAAQTAGDMDQAKALDKLARKVNAALTSSNPTVRGLRKTLGGPSPSPVRWQDMPSTLDP